MFGVYVAQKALPHPSRESFIYYPLSSASCRSTNALHASPYRYTPSDVLRGKLHSMNRRMAHWRLIQINFPLRLNSRAGVFALSLATWHGLRIVSHSTSYFMPRISSDHPLSLDPSTHLPSPHRGTLLHPSPRRPQSSAIGDETPQTLPAYPLLGIPPHSTGFPNKPEHYDPSCRKG